jgi:hypothetical protein
MSKPEFHVEAYAGYKGEETPRSFTVDGTPHPVAEIVGRWYSENHAYFAVRTTSGHRYVLRYDLGGFMWALVMCENDR